MLGFLKHYFFPHEKNNHRAKLLHNFSLFVFILFFFLITLAAGYIKNTHPDILGVSYSISEGDLLSLVNAQRQSHGLASLSLNAQLDDAARRKAADMFQKNYWAHFAPDGSSSPWGFIRAAGYNYIFAGENLAKGFTDAPSTVNAWMASPTHRDNILSEKYKDVGFAIVPGTLQGEETVLVVEMFGSSSSQTVSQVTQTAANVAGTQTEPSPTAAPTFIPTAAPTAVPLVVKTSAYVPASPAGSIENKPRFDAAVTSRAASGVGLTFIGLGFIMDLLIIERKKIPRVVGHNLDHILLFVTFAVFMFLLRGGVII